MGPEDYQELQNNDKLDDKKRLRAFIWKEEEIVKVKIPRRSSIDIEIVNAKIRQIEILLRCVSYIYVFLSFYQCGLKIVNYSCKHFTSQK